MDVSLFQDSQIEINRADESEVDTVIGYDAEHSARKRVSRNTNVHQRSFRRWMFRRRWSGIQRRTESKATLIMMKVRRHVSMKNGLWEYLILRGLGITTTSMGGGTVVCGYTIEWYSQIVSMQKMAIVCHTRYVMIG